MYTALWCDVEKWYIPQHHSTTSFKISSPKYILHRSLSFLGENHLTDYYRQTSVIIQCVVDTGLGPTLKLFVLAGFGTGFPRFLDIWILSRHFWSSFILPSEAIVEFSFNIISIQVEQGKPDRFVYI